jgi:hypothetical protein
MNDIDATLKALLNRTAELKAFETALREQTAALIDLLGKEQKQPDLKEALVAALQTLKLPAPVNNLPAPVLNVSPTMTTPKGAAWRVEGEDALGKKFSMTITKL